MDTFKRAEDHVYQLQDFFTYDQTPALYHAAIRSHSHRIPTKPDILGRPEIRQVVQRQKAVGSPQQVVRMFGQRRTV